MILIAKISLYTESLPCKNQSKTDKKALDIWILFSERKTVVSVRKWKQSDYTAIIVTYFVSNVDSMLQYK